MSQETTQDTMTPEYSRWLAKAKMAAEYAFGDALAGTIIAEEGIQAGSKEKFDKAAFLDFLIEQMEKEQAEGKTKPAGKPKKKEWRYQN